MNSTFWTKRMAVVAIMGAVVGAGALWTAEQGISSRASAAPAAPAAAATMAAEESIATINGKDINVKKFDDLMMEVAGLRVFQEVLDLVLVQQACQGAGIAVVGPEFEKHVKEELDRTYAGLTKQGVPKEDLERVLSTLLQKQGITNVEFQMGLQRAAGLRQLAAGKVIPPTKEEIQSFYDSEYGEKVHLEVLTVKDRKMAADVREKITKGEEPRAVAGAMGLPWQQMIIPMNNTDPDPIKTFKDLAFGQLKEKELSATIPFTPKGGAEMFYLIYLEKKDPKSSQLLSAVQKTVEEQVAAAKEENWMKQRLVDLRNTAQVKINDPILSKLFAEIAAQMQRNAAATQAATQPKAPMTPPSTLPPILPPATMPAIPR